MPIAAASIGQVHRAITHEGVAVAVKVQYPGVGEAIEADLGSVGLVFGGLGQIVPGLRLRPARRRAAHPAPRGARLRLEARAPAAVRRLLRRPPVHPHPRGARRVLVTGGCSPPSSRKACASPRRRRGPRTSATSRRETIFRFVFGSLYRLRLFNGDPHPGNYLFRPGGRVTFLDFGLVKPFSDAEIASSARAHRDDGARARPGRVPPRGGGRRVPAGRARRSPTTQVVDYFGHFYELPPGGPAVARDQPEFASENVRRVFDATGPYREVMRHANVPPAFVIVQRINLGLFAVLAQLGATANWRRLAEELWPWVERSAVDAARASSSTSGGPMEIRHGRCAAPVGRRPGHPGASGPTRGRRPGR